MGRLFRQWLAPLGHHWDTAGTCPYPGVLPGGLRLHVVALSLGARVPLTGQAFPVWTAIQVTFAERWCAIAKNPQDLAYFAGWHCRCSGGPEKVSMVDALFNQPEYLGAKKMLDAVVLRQEAISSNIANLETPGYKRIDLAPSFQDELQRACASGDAQQIGELQPTLATDPNAVPQGLDGNTVSLEKELAQLNQNSLTHSLETQLVTNTLYRLKMAISGKSA